MNNTNHQSAAKARTNRHAKQNFITFPSRFLKQFKRNMSLLIIFDLAKSFLFCCFCCFFSVSIGDVKSLHGLLINCTNMNHSAFIELVNDICTQGQLPHSCIAKVFMANYQSLINCTKMNLFCFQWAGQYLYPSQLLHLCNNFHGSLITLLSMSQ